MAIKKTQQQFLQDCIDKHGTRYDYTKAYYTSANNKITIICRRHGEFDQRASAHLNGQNCPTCSQGPNWQPGILTTAAFIAKAETIHGSTYDYSEVNYVNDTTKITIICKKHGAFKIKPGAHTRLLHGCAKCAGNQRLTTNTFILKSQSIHGLRYDYSKANYVNATSKVEIICQLHGLFKQSPKSHIHLKNGCPKCAIDSVKSILKKDQSIFIEEVKALHSNKYDYSKVNYKARHLPIEIICPEHGIFKQKASEHLRGYGCSRCARNERLTKREFARRCDIKHRGKFDYTAVEYVNQKKMITLNCAYHGEFITSCKNHMTGSGCPKCGVSTDQLRLIELVETSGVDFSINDRKIISPLELDIYIPSRKLAIEYNGDYWHSYNHQESSRQKHKHQHKATQCIKAGVSLIQIDTYELHHKIDIIRSMINYKLGRSMRIGARQTAVVKITSTQAFNFHELNHINGGRTAAINYALIRNNEIMACINFSKNQAGWEIIRFSNKLNTAISGGFSKLLKQFIIDHRPDNIITFADLRYGTGDVYKQSGFQYTHTTKPGYVYIDLNSQQKHSRIKFQKHKLHKLLKIFNPSLSESENMFMNGYRRLWDAGHNKFKWTP